MNFKKENNYIYIDGWFLKPPLRGVGNYIKNILIHLPKPDKDFEYVLLIPSGEMKLPFLSKYLKIKIIPCKSVVFWYEFLMIWGCQNGKTA